MSSRDARGDLGKVMKVVRKAGWRIEPSRDGYKLYSPNGKDIVQVHWSSSDVAAIRNIKADLKRAGLVV